MSRGLGRKQREIVAALRDASRPLQPHEVRAATGTYDRPNTRRALRTLQHRGIAVQDDGGRWTLDPDENFRLSLMESFKEIEEERLAEVRLRRERDRALVRYVEEQKQQSRDYIRWYWEREDLWEDDPPDYERHREPTQNQTLILVLIERYADPPEMGLSEGAVRAVALERIGDKSNYRRAVRSLVRNRYLQRSKDGERLRCRPWHRWMDYRAREFRVLSRGWSLHLIDEPDWKKVEAVLEGFGELEGEVA